MEIKKKQISISYSFGIDGINDEWKLISEWEGFAKYQNKDNYIIITHSTINQNDDFLSKFIAELSIGNAENIIMASPQVLEIIGKNND